MTIYDQEFAQPDAGLAELVDQMTPGPLRFPGGSATENYFDMTNPNSATSAHPDSPPLTPMDDFFTAAGQIGSDVVLVVPTQVGFAKTATEALRDGEYGARDQLAATYLADLETFVRTAFAEAAANGVAITAMEIGNEFWGSGEMTASEYGWIAGRVAVHLQQILIDLGLREDVTIAAQSTAAASAVYAPRDDVHVFIDVEHGEEVLRSQAYVDKHFGGIPPAHYAPVTIPGTGSASAQLQDLTAQINAVPGAAAALDGVILHMYLRGGLDVVDDGRNFVFDQLQNFEDRLNRPADAEPMRYLITEWNAATGNRDDNAGLKHASMLIEGMYELTTNGVTDAQVWPLTFNAAQGTSMVDLGDQRLAIAGEMYRLMAESLPDLAPVLDWSVQGQLDIHGFANEARAVLFVSERSGAAQTDIDLHTGAVLDPGKYVISLTELWDGGAGGEDDQAAPVITELGAFTADADVLEFDLNAWANLRIELTEVGGGNDRVETGAQADRIYTYGGNDTVRTGDGSDLIHGGGGADNLHGGAQQDWVIGSTGDDRLNGGAGKDTLIFQTGDGKDRVDNYEFGLDRLMINDVLVFSFADLAYVDGAEWVTTSGRLSVHYGAGDVITLNNIYLSNGADMPGRIDGGDRFDILRGSDGQDDIRGRNGADFLEDGAGRDFLRGGNGADLFVLVRDGERDVITDFQHGRDKIDLSAWGVGRFEDLDISVEYDENGLWTGRGWIRYEDEDLRIDGMDAAMQAAFTAQDVLL